LEIGIDIYIGINKIGAMKYRFITFLMVITFACKVSAQECNCGESFDWMVNIIEKNDAGFQYVVDKKGADDYKRFTDNLKQEAKNATSLSACQEIMNNWLHYFRNGHIGVMRKESNENVKKLSDEEIRQQFKNEKIIDLTDKQLIAILEKKHDKNPIEGIWKDNGDGNQYTIGIIGNEDSGKKFTAFIIKADSVVWMPNQIKAVFTSTDDKKIFSVDYYLRDHTKQNFQAKFVDDSFNMFRLYNVYWTRIYPENTLTPKEKLLLSSTNSIYKSKLPFVEKLSDKTVFLRIPSFEYDQKKYIDSTLARWDTIITSTLNLIIDIRNGTGGSDYSWMKILPYLYTNTIRQIKSQYFATELNAKEYDNYAKKIPDTSISAHCSYIAKKMREHLGEFITLSESKYDTFTLDKVFPYPQKVAILCDKSNGSADEGFLYVAKQSTKVKVFGRPTLGCLDISNVNMIDFPNGKWMLFYGMTKSLRIPDYCIDGVGIQPDYFIDDAIMDDDWVEYARAILENK